MESASFMKIIIVGCGEAGQTLAGQLNGEGNDITVIDRDADKVRDVALRYDIKGIVGNGATIATLRDADIHGADLLIAVTGSDEMNLLCCIIAKKESNCRTIARLENPDYSSETSYLKDELGLAMIINPDYAVAKEIARLLRFPTAISIDTFAKGRVELLKFKIPEDCMLVNLSVKEAVSKFNLDLLFCTVEREDGVYIVNGDFVFSGKDIISFVATPRSAQDFFKKIKYTTHAVKSAIIVGAGKTTKYLCEILGRSDISLKIIEKDRAVCEELCSQFEGVTVINADPTDKDALVEEGVASADAFIALSKQDEENILLSLSAKNLSNAKLITSIDRPDYEDLVRQLGLDSTIYPKNITSNMITRYVRATKNTRGSNMQTLYNIIKDKVEASEFIIKEPSLVVGVPLSKLKIKENILICAILRDKAVIIPRGQDTIQVGDAVVVVSAKTMLNDITDILKK